MDKTHWLGTDVLMLLNQGDRTAFDVAMKAGAARLARILQGEGWLGPTSREIAIDAMMGLLVELPPDITRLSEFDEKLLDSLNKARQRKIRRLEETGMDIARAVAVQQEFQRPASSSLGALEVHCVSRPILELNGDFFRIVHANPVAIDAGAPDAILAFGDATYHGASAALTATLTMGWLEGLLQCTTDATGLHPARLMHTINYLAQLHSAKREAVALALIGWWSPMRRVSLCLAGMWPFLVVRPDTSLVVGDPGLPVGLLTKEQQSQLPDYSSSEVALNSGDLLVAVSDGVAELNWMEDRYFGARLGDLCGSLLGRPLSDIARAVLDEVAEDAFDDQSILLARLS